MGKERPQSSKLYKSGAVPYTKLPAEAAKETWLGRLSSLVTAGRDAEQDRPLRDFAFGAKGGIIYFSRRKDVLEPFGYYHNQRLQYGSPSPMEGTSTTVVGVRGGRLYVLDEEEDVALPLVGSTQAELTDRYGFQLLNEDGSLEQPELPEEWTNEDIAFLQTAPDVILAVGSCGTPVYMPPRFCKDGLLGWAGENPIILNSGNVLGVPAQVVASMVINPDETAEDHQDQIPGIAHQDGQKEEEEEGAVEEE